MPSHPASHLVLIQTHFALALREALLNGPSAARNASEFFQRRARRGEGQIEGDLLFFGVRAAQEQKALPVAGIIRMVKSQGRPVEEPGALGSRPRAEARGLCVALAACQLSAMEDGLSLLPSVAFAGAVASAARAVAQPLQKARRSLRSADGGHH
jgi:hypothetical protein